MSNEICALRPKRILLVDDDPDCRSLILAGLEELTDNMSVCEVDNAREAMEYLHRRGAYGEAARADMIFLDLAMPGPSGQSVLKQVKSDPELRDIPVVVLTGLPEGEQIDQALASGADSYLLKPVDPMEFLEAVQAAAALWLGADG